MTPSQFSYHVHLAHRTLPHGERPTRLHCKIARTLARWQHSMPSHAKLARAARCCVNTVGNALARFRRLGMLDWKHEGAVMRSGRRLRLPNRYRFVASFLLFPTAVQKTQEILAPNLHLPKHRPQPPQRTVAEQLAWLAAH